MEAGKHYDHLLSITVIILLTVGVVMVYSASSISASVKFRDSIYFLKRQLCFAFLGLLLMLALMHIRYQFLKKLTYPLFIISILLLVLVLVPGIGSTIGGSTRWFRLGVFSAQPSELAKLALIIFFASSLSKKNKNMHSFTKTFLPHLLVTLFLCMLVLLQPDFGTAVIFCALFFIVMFVAGCKLTHLLYLCLTMATACYFLISCVGYRLHRIKAYFNPWEDPTATGFQIIQSFLALGSGGLWGTGLGNGKQKLFYLPEPHTDFIFSIIGEELGLIGVMLVIALFITLCFCGMRIALRAPDLFGTYLALGITSLIVLHALVNLGVVTGLLPTKGSTLPFISYGGTSLVVNLMGVGILLNISSQPTIKRAL